MAERDGVYVEGTFERIVKQTVAPKPGGKQFAPFQKDLVIVSMYDGEVERVVEYREGAVPDDLALAEAGQRVRIPVTVRGFFGGRPQFAGKTVA